MQMPYSIASFAMHIVSISQAPVCARNASQRLVPTNVPRERRPQNNACNPLPSQQPKEGNALRQASAPPTSKHQEWHTGDDGKGGPVRWHKRPRSQPGSGGP
jgi:hypothetical protein